ncbi:ferritin-like domain-containing protein [Nocardiopsis quinghaiensis]|uniref:ferritin-like domain-containing protein n=1 Tax=Nocardiopsis quinghaiensis TaxID=464995 RepID=UPI0012394AB1|nr:ferritin-like domain-containing protein [Nocardiopsis quinghaiensis]
MGIGCVSRRTVLGATAAVGTGVLAGCGGTEWYPSDMTPDEYVLRSVIREKERMVTRYEAAVAGDSGPPELLERFLEHHLSHLDALLEALPEDSAPTPSAEGPDASPSAPEEDPALDAVRGAAGLGVLEAAATSARLDQAGAVTDPGLSQLISAIGACEAGHAHLLAEA